VFFFIEIGRAVVDCEEFPENGALIRHISGFVGRQKLFPSPSWIRAKLIKE